MNKDKYKDMDIVQLLNDCTSPYPAEREKGWKQFLVFYKEHMYRVAKSRCLKSGNNKIKANLNHEVDDIVAQVIIKLMNKDFKLLKQYNPTNGASLFRIYLGTITDRVAKRHLQNYYNDNVSQFDPTERPDLSEHITVENEWEWYDESVFLLRKALKKKSIKNEQKIHLYMMFYRGDMPVEVILGHKFYNKIGTDVFYTTMNRISKKLKKKV